MSCYEEFALLPEQAKELGLPPDRMPAARREALEVAPGRSLSLLVWGSGRAQLVLLHGGAQNAHTWDRVALLLGRPLVAVDLAGHGHSDWRGDRDYSPQAHADDLAPAVRRLAPRAAAVVGMSIGGLAGVALASAHPELVRRLVLVDVTPGSRSTAARSIDRFVNDALVRPPSSNWSTTLWSRCPVPTRSRSGGGSFTIPSWARTGPGPGSTIWAASMRTRCSPSSGPSRPCGDSWRA